MVIITLPMLLCKQVYIISIVKMLTTDERMSSANRKLDISKGSDKIVWIDALLQDSPLGLFVLQY